MGSSSLMQPAQVGLRNVSPAPGAQGQDGAVATGGGIDQASPGDNRGNGFLGWPRQRPEFPARIRMIALYVKGTIVDEFILIGHAHDHRVGPPHGLSTVMLPKHRSGLLVQGHENRFTSVLILNENDLVTIEYRAGRRSMHRGEITDVLLPLKFPLHVIAHKTAIAEEGDDAFSIRHRRRRRIGILANDSLDRLRRGSRPLPLQFASRSRKAEQFPGLAVFRRRGEEEPIVPDDGRAVASAGQLDLPQDILRPTPGQGEFRFQGYPLSRGTAKTGPLPLRTRGG